MNLSTIKIIQFLSIAALLLVLTVLSTQSVMMEENLNLVEAIPFGIMAFVMFLTAYYILAAIFRHFRQWWKKRTLTANKITKNMPWFVLIAVIVVYIWFQFIPHFVVHPPWEVNPDKPFERSFILENDSRSKPKE